MTSRKCKTNSGRQEWTSDRDWKPSIQPTTSSTSVSAIYANLPSDKVIKREVEKFKDADSMENMERINSDMFEIQNALSESFDLLLDKDKKIGGKLYDPNPQTSTTAQTS